MIFTSPSVKRDRAGEPDGSSSKIDGGVPHYHSLDEPAAPAPGKSDIDKRFDQIEADLKATRAEAAEQRDLAKYWAEQAKKGKTAEPEPDPEPVTPPRQVRKAREGERPEELLDDLSKEGLAALWKRGTITDEEFYAELDKRDANLLKSVDKKIEAAAAGSEFDQKLGREFPELVEDNIRVSKGEQPKGELFKRTAEHFREMIDDAGVKPDSAAARGLMYSAAKLAKKELDMEGQNTRRRSDDNSDSEDRRRSRIDAQSGDRGGGRDDQGDDDAPTLSKQQLVMAKNLGVTPAEIDAQVKKAGRNGR